jgi:hypothetical protein
MTIGRPIGQTGFISSPIVRVEDSTLWAHARPRGNMASRVRHESPPPSDEQVARDKAYLNHDTARAAAARRGKVVVHTAEDVNARAVAQVAAAQAQGAATGGASSLAELATLRAALSAQQAVSRAQAETIERLVVRLDALDGNPDGVIGLNGDGT